MTAKFSLGPLSDPATHTAPIALANRSTEQLLDWYGTMMRIRLGEEAIAELSISGEAKCPCHLGIGQEAVAVGMSSALRASDRVYGTHRSHAHYVALGGCVDAMMAEILGKETGTSRGMGGSMHLYGPEWGFHGSVPIVGATIPIAAGAALATKMDGKGDVAVCYFGDGACEEGVLHETLNMARVMDLPVIFVCENNLFSSHLEIDQRQPFNSVARFGEAAGMMTRLVDGNDVVAMSAVAHEVVDNARNGGGPAFVEAVTFRWRGHVGPNEDIDVGVQRRPETLAAWKRRDPVRRLQDALVADRGVEPARFDAIIAEDRSRIEAAVGAARAAPYPPVENLMNFVYAAPIAGGAR